MLTLVQAAIGVGLFYLLTLLYRFNPKHRVHKTGAVVVTGCSSGIGRDVALTLARLGYGQVASLQE